MIVDLAREAVLPNFPPDVCIVGAGAAGIVLATELVRQNRRVLLLESGGAVVEPEAQALNVFEHAGQLRREAHIGRFRALGGTTTAWGGQVLELDAEDFDRRSWIPGSGWPFPKSELQPYYDRALSAERLAHVIRTDEEVWCEMKMPSPDFGDAITAYFTRWCPEPNFAHVYRETFKSPNLCVVLHATAIGLMFSESGMRIDGVRVRTSSGAEQAFIATQYVLCLGTIETVRFLLQPQPGVQFPGWNRSGVLGRHFQSHIDYNAAAISSEDAARLWPLFANAYIGGLKYHPKVRLSSAIQLQQKILTVGASIACINPNEKELRKAKALARNVVQGNGSGIWANLPAAFRHLSLLLRMGYSYRFEHRAHWPKNSAFWLRVHCEQEPLSESRVTLTDTRDAAGLFQARFDWRVSPLEWKTIRAFSEQVQQSFAALGISKIAIAPELMREDGFRDIVFDNSHHQMGGTRMASSATEGVVDPQLRLHGLENAYVCSASVFPCSGFSNPTHTLLALAIRLADHLVKASAHA